MDDPDAPGGTWTHWLVWDIPAHVHSLSGAIETDATPKSGTNDFGKQGYGGPCPPKHKGPHRYFFRVFALDVEKIGVRQGAKRADVGQALRKHVLAEATYMGRYERK
jgi:Raf kinase inhibitor-like YbhB/YbcL family protein